MAEESGQKAADAKAAAANRPAEVRVKEFRPVLEESNAWVSLTDGVDLTYRDNEVLGPEDGLHRDLSGRLYMLARRVLESNGFAVEGSYEPRLVIRVVEA